MNAKSCLSRWGLSVCLSVCLCSGDLDEMKTFFLRDFQADTIESLDLKYPDRLQLEPVSKFRSRFKAVIVSDDVHRKATDQYDDLQDVRSFAIQSLKCLFEQNYSSPPRKCSLLALSSRRRSVWRIWCRVQTYVIALLDSTWYSKARLFNYESWISISTYAEARWYKINRRYDFNGRYCTIV